MATDSYEYAAQEYAAHAALSDDPDYCGMLLYQAAVAACDQAERAARTEDWGVWDTAVGQAQIIVAQFVDIARDDSEAARIFKTFHQLIWTALWNALRDKDADALQSAQAGLQECLKQITARVHRKATESSIEPTTW